jgi:cell migration-inducing and hyaluronan-binding protein
VHFPKIDPRFDNDNRGGVAWRTAAIHDLDGSVGGIPNAYILINDGENDSVATDETCKVQPTWNAAVCTGDVGRLFLNRPGGTLAELSAGTPVLLSRNGKDFRITGNQSNVRAGTEIRVKTERPEVNLSVREMDQGSWVVFELPGYTQAASGKQQTSLDALRKASESSYFKDKDALWVKLVVTDANYQGPVVEPVGRLVAQASVTVSR